DRAERMRARPGDQHADAAANERKEKTLGQQQSNESPSPSAYGYAYGDLTSPGAGSAEEQIGDVDACDQQNEYDGAEQHEQRALDGRVEPGVVERQCRHLPAQAAHGIRIGGGDTRAERTRRGDRLRYGNRGKAPRNDEKTIIVGSEPGGRQRRRRQQHVRFASESAKVLGPDTDDRPRRAVDVECAADDGWVAGEAALPKRVRD